MSQFRNLVFEGGGVKGIAYAGALEFLDQKGDILPEIRRVAGTSAGAITAAILALGARSQEIKEIVGGTDFRKFMDDSFGLVRDTRRLLNSYGWYKGDAFAQWMRKQVYALSGVPDMTLRELRVKAQAEPGRYRELYVIGTNLSMQVPELLSHETYPDMPVWKAVRISMSIPLFFAAVFEYAGVWVDGGLTWNYPIDLFDDLRFVEDPSRTETYTRVDYPTKYHENHVYNKQTLGFRVDTEDEIRAEKEGWRKPPAEINHFLDYVKILVGCITEMANKSHLHQNDWHRTVFIDAGGVKTTEFNLPREKVDQLVENGRQGTEAYFQWFEDPNQQPLNRVDHMDSRSSTPKTTSKTTRKRPG